jgi:hypothetical protein
MPTGKKRKAASNELEENGERRPPEFVCKCDDSENSTHKYAIQCDRDRKLSIHQNISNR